jgi:hypothetical protein
MVMLQSKPGTRASRSSERKGERNRNGHSGCVVIDYTEYALRFVKC